MPGWDWDLIKSIFEQAKEAPPEELDRLLASHCGGDSGMEAFLRSLVGNHRDASAAVLSERGRVFADGQVVAKRLRVIRFIDQGAMGEVYEAFDERLRQRVALKTVRGEMIQSLDARARFEREIRMAREVAHENLCRVFDYVEDQSGIPCFTMELIEGESLAERLVRDRPLQSSAALPLIQQIAQGLGALHARGIIHRDLKPSNIMLVEKPAVRVVLMDFGLAKLLHPEAELFQTNIQQQMGAPYFMAPELLKNGSPSVASDLYAFGLIVDEMVTWSRAFAAQSLQSLYFAKLWEEPIPPGMRSEGMPENWRRAIVKCIAGEAEDRFATAGDFVAALKSAVPLVSDPPRTKRLPAWLPRLATRQVAASGLGACLLGSGFVLAAWANRPVNAEVRVYDLENATGDPSMNYLCKGTANELIRRLTGLEGIRVVPMHESRRPGLREKSDGVAVEGTLLGSGGELRLTVLLTDGKTGETFDSEKLDADPRDSLRIQNALAANTVAKLESHVLSKKAFLSGLAPMISKLRLNWFRPWNQAASGPTSNGAAFDSYLRGRQLVDEFTRASMEAALPYLRSAVELDPSFALGHATLAEAQLNLMAFMQTPQQEMLFAAKRSAAIAASLDPQLPEAQAVEAYVLQTEWDWFGAADHFQKALSLKPGYAAARRRYAGLLLQFGRWEEALPMAEQAFSSDPYDRGSIPAIGLYYFLAGKYDAAIRFLEQEIGENDMQGARHNLGDALAEAAVHADAGERVKYFERALAQARRVMAIERKTAGPDGFAPMGDEMFCHYYTLMGDSVSAEPYFKRLLTEMRLGLASPAIVAWIYALRGEKDTALSLLEEALDSHDRRMLYVKLFPALASLRGETRFQVIVNRMKL